MSKSCLITCPHCHRNNRVPAARLTGEGKCGACKQPLFSKQPVTLTAANCKRHIDSDLPLVIDFWAPWCGPCRSFAPVFAEAARVLEPRARFGKVNTEQEQALAAQYGIRSIPTLILFHHGREVQRIAGALPGAQFQQWVVANLPQSE